MPRRRSASTPRVGTGIIVSYADHYALKVPDEAVQGRLLPPAAAGLCVTPFIIYLAMAPRFAFPGESIHGFDQLLQIHGSTSRPLTEQGRDVPFHRGWISATHRVLCLTIPRAHLVPEGE